MTADKNGFSLAMSAYSSACLLTFSLLILTSHQLWNLFQPPRTRLNLQLLYSRGINFYSAIFYSL